MPAVSAPPVRLAPVAVGWAAPYWARVPFAPAPTWTIAARS